MFDRRPDRARRAGRAALLPRGADIAHRVAAPCRRRPNADSRSGRFADRDARSPRSRAPRRSARPARRRSPRCGRSHLRAPSGWPVRRGASARARGPRCGRSPRRPARRDSRNSRGSSPPRSGAAGGGRAIASQMLRLIVAGRSRAACRLGEGGVEMVFRALEMRRHGPESSFVPYRPPRARRA